MHKCKNVVVLNVMYGCVCKCVVVFTIHNIKNWRVNRLYYPNKSVPHLECCAVQLE